MPETASTYFPDLPIAWSPRRLRRFRTEVEKALNGRQQRRALFPTGGYRGWNARTLPLTQVQRETLDLFVIARNGGYDTFYFFAPDPEALTDYACGTVSASSTFTLPLKLTGPDAFIGSITVVKVAGVSKAFTIANTGPGGEAVVTFTAGAQTGAVTVTGEARVRVIAVMGDEFQIDYVPGAGIYSVASFDIQEVR